MTLTEEMKWLYILTVIKTSQTGKILSLEQKQAIEEFIRKKICPSIDYKKWLEIEKDMIKMKTEIMKLMYEGMVSSIGKGGLPKEAKEMFEQADLARLDDSMRGSIRELDFDKIENVFNELPEEQRKYLEPMFKEVKKISEQYKQEKKNG